MKNIRLENTDLTVSNIALGTDSYGSLIDEAFSFEMLDFYADKGGNLLDTAECYAQWIPGGEHASERTIGKWMKDKKNRHNTIISTKGGHFALGQRHRLTEKDIFEDLEGSLRRLQTDYIDIYWLHRDAPQVPVTEVMRVLDKAVRQGKVRYIGVSNWSCERLDAANCYAKENGMSQLIASQIQYSSAMPNKDKNEPDLVLMNDNEYVYFKNHNLTVFAFAAQAKGFFTKYYNGGQDALSEKAYARYLNSETLSRYENIKALSEERGYTIGNTVVAAITNNYDFTAVPIIGCKTIAQLKDSLAGGDITLSKDDLDFLFNRQIT